MSLPGCKGCGVRWVAVKGYCWSCYNKLRRYGDVNGGTERTYPPNAVCKTCKRPRVQLRKWECATCYNYRLRTKKKRPRDLIEKAAPRGWCACGEPVATSFRTRIGKIDVCWDCMLLEKK